MEYWHATKDESYTNVMMEALVSQLGPNYDFDRPEEAFDTGNDDQAFWVFVALAAAEYGFPPPPGPAPGWHMIAQNAWNDYVYRWNTTMCGGGLKCWYLRQIRTSPLTCSRAIPLRKRRLLLQEFNLEWRFLPGFGSTCSVHWQSDLHRLG